MQHEEVDPLGDDVAGQCGNDLFEVSHFIELQRQMPCNTGVAESRHCAVYQDDLGARFSALALAKNMHWIMLVGIEQDNQAEIFVKLWHGIFQALQNMMEES
jgi:hypothetical protein